jgi:bifunctional UDP-N-acetylglucosamine pyrophosphorylase/glucosamine-1-phosphate N-acetyltransferase
MHTDTIAVILAAGKGTRMKSNRAKVLHEVFFKPMLHHVLDAVFAASIPDVAVIVGHDREAVEKSICDHDYTPVVQKEQLGTGHAVLCARDACQGRQQVMILCGDTPLIRPETLSAMLDAHKNSNATITLMTTILAEPFGYGRIISNEDGTIAEIVEEKDASPEQRRIQEINTGIYLVRQDFLFHALVQVGTNNSQGEVYLTDIISIAGQEGERVGKFLHPEAIDVLGVNSRVELAKAHDELLMRRNRELMLAGVTMYQPHTITIQPGITIGLDTVLEAGVCLTGKTRVGCNAYFHGGAALHSCQVGKESVIGNHAVLHNTTVEDEEHIPPLTYRVG